MPTIDPDFDPLAALPEDLHHRDQAFRYAVVSFALIGGVGMAVAGLMIGHHYRDLLPGREEADSLQVALAILWGVSGGLLLGSLPVMFRRRAPWLGAPFLVPPAMLALLWLFTEWTRRRMKPPTRWVLAAFLLCLLAAGAAGTVRIVRWNLSLDETPRRAVTLDRPYYVSETAITVRQFTAVMGAEILTSRKESWRNRPLDRWDRLSEPASAPMDINGPALWATWGDATAFCEKLSQRVHKPVRLLTEAEWQFANCDAPGAGAWGLRGFSDGHGEWCRDIYDPRAYARTAAIRPETTANPDPEKAPARIVRREEGAASTRKGYSDTLADGRVCFRILVEVE
ncbi:MAG: SUMF1/EgtB/PvdO family nonheme iron enzyme [Planctomycetes bacterium]|nr:SUMF1/EgtB/PvdO family nonheme iron enzyme [Planctomycetota bacterium]